MNSLRKFRKKSKMEFRWDSSLWIAEIWKKYIYTEQLEYRFETEITLMEKEIAWLFCCMTRPGLYCKCDPVNYDGRIIGHFSMCNLFFKSLTFRLSNCFARCNNHYLIQQVEDIENFLKGCIKSKVELSF